MILDAYQELYQRVRTFCFNDPTDHLSFCDRLSENNGWSEEFSQRVLEEYCRFIVLAIAAQQPVIPPEPIDTAWRLHLLYYRSYWEVFCPKVLRRRLPHWALGTRNLEGKALLERYDQTKKAYRNLFGEYPPAEIWRSGFSILGF